MASLSEILMASEGYLWVVHWYTEKRASQQLNQKTKKKFIKWGTDLKQMKNSNICHLDPTSTKNKQLKQSSFWKSPISRFQLELPGKSLSLPASSAKESNFVGRKHNLVWKCFFWVKRKPIMCLIFGLKNTNLVLNVSFDWEVRFQPERWSRPERRGASRWETLRSRKHLGPGCHTKRCWNYYCYYLCYFYYLCPVNIWN